MKPVFWIYLVNQEEFRGIGKGFYIRFLSIF